MERLRRLTRWWAARSLALGALSTTLDLCVGGLVLALGGPTRAAAMCGTAVGALWTFFANRRLAFRDHEAPLGRSALAFVVAQAALSALHGQAVVLLRERAGLPYVGAKLAADLLVITFPQLWLLRNVVFPRGR